MLCGTQAHMAGISVEEIYGKYGELHIQNPAFCILSGFTVKNDNLVPFIQKTAALHACFADILIINQK